MWIDFICKTKSDTENVTYWWSTKSIYVPYHNLEHRRIVFDLQIPGQIGSMVTLELNSSLYYCNNVYSIFFVLELLTTTTSQLQVTIEQVIQVVAYFLGHSDCVFNHRDNDCDLRDYTWFGTYKTISFVFHHFTLTNILHRLP